MFVQELDELSDAAWEALAPHTAGKATDVGRTGADKRLFLTAVFGVARHGCAWRALPARFGRHDTVRKRSRRWAQQGVWKRLFQAVQRPDLDWVLLDSTLVRAHALAATSRKKTAQGTKPSGAAAAG